MALQPSATRIPATDFDACGGCGRCARCRCARVNARTRNLLRRFLAATREYLLKPSFWLGISLSFPIEHFIWEKVWPFSVLTKLLGL